MKIDELVENTNSLCGNNTNESISVTVSEVSIMHDFAGNEYTLIECMPTGYLIYHGESGIFVEALIENKDSNILNYTSGKSDEIYEPDISVYGKYLVVDNYSFFTNMYWCGYQTIDGNGICGYIAAGMLLTYDQATYADNRPVIWFGYITDNTFNSAQNITHAVVVYGYYSTSTSCSFIAHFGWEGASVVYFSGVLGSMYTYQV